VYAHVGGVPKKPSPEFYSVVCAAAAAPPSSIVHVGDSVAHDVVGAQAAGLRAVWLNRGGRPRPSAVHPDAEISSLAELQSALAALNPAKAPSHTAR
jgi:putative hydrolase of the HAD superfamily